MALTTIAILTFKNVCLWNFEDSFTILNLGKKDHLSNSQAMWKQQWPTLLLFILLSSVLVLQRPGPNPLKENFA